MYCRLGKLIKSIYLPIVTAVALVWFISPAGLLHIPRSLRFFYFETGIFVTKSNEKIKA